MGPCVRKFSCTGDTVDLTAIPHVEMSPEICIKAAMTKKTEGCKYTCETPPCEKLYQYGGEEDGPLNQAMFALCDQEGFEADCEEMKKDERESERREKKESERRENGKNAGKPRSKKTL